MGINLSSIIPIGPLPNLETVFVPLAYTFYRGAGVQPGSRRLYLFRPETYSIGVEGRTKRGGSERRRLNAAVERIVRIPYSFNA